MFKTYFKLVYSRVDHCPPAGSPNNRAVATENSHELDYSVLPLTYDLNCLLFAIWDLKAAIGNLSISGRSQKVCAWLSVKLGAIQLLIL